MRIALDLVAHVSWDYTAEDYQWIIEETLRRSHVASFLSGRDVALDVALLSAQESQRANNALREKDASTDVISVGHYSEDRMLLQKESAKSIHLGELLLCPAFIEESAIIDHVEPAHAFAYVLSHGVLHLVGYDHSPEMFTLQDAVSEAFLQQRN